MRVPGGPCERGASRKDRTLRVAGENFGWPHDKGVLERKVAVLGKVCQAASGAAELNGRRGPLRSLARRGVLRRSSRGRARCGPGGDWRCKLARRRRSSPASRGGSVEY